MLKKIIKIFIIFLFITFFNNIDCFAVDFDSSHYVEVNGLSISGKYRICCNEDFYLLPEDGYFSPFSMATDERVKVSLYRYNDDNTYNDYYNREVNKQIVSVTYNVNFFNANGNVIVYKDSTKTDYYFRSEKILPYILDSDENLKYLNMDNLTIDSGTIDIAGDGHINFIISINAVGSSSASFVYVTTLNKSSVFYKSGGINGDYYEIPVSVFKDKLIPGYNVDYWLDWTEAGSSSYSNSVRSVIFNPEDTELTDTEKTNNILNSRFNILFNLLEKNHSKETELREQEQETRKRYFSNC